MSERTAAPPRLRCVLCICRCCRPPQHGPSPAQRMPGPLAFIFSSSRSHRMRLSSCTSCCWKASAVSQPKERVRSLVDTGPAVNWSCNGEAEEEGGEEGGCEPEGVEQMLRGARKIPAARSTSSMNAAMPEQWGVQVQSCLLAAGTCLVEHALQRQGHAAGGLCILRGGHVVHGLRSKQPQAGQAGQGGTGAAADVKRLQPICAGFASFPVPLHVRQQLVSLLCSQLQAGGHPALGAAVCNPRQGSASSQPPAAPGLPCGTG